MNLNQLWAGSDYAYYSMRGRGEAYREGAVRVRVVRAYQRRAFTNERMSGFAEVFLLHDDGSSRVNGDGEPRKAEVRARDIAMRWDEYADEREHRHAERDRLNREREEAAAKEQAERDALLEALEEFYHIPKNAVTSIDSYQIRIQRSALEEDLGAKRNG
jgi:hypothetical protein